MAGGLKKPSIRFAGFTAAWEQRGFSSIAFRRSEMTAESGLPRVEYEDIIPEVGILNKDLSEKNSDKQGIGFYVGDVLYGKLRPYLHNWLLPSFNGIAVGDFWVLESQDADSKFLYRLVQSSKFDEIVNQSTGTKMPRADWKLISKTQFSIPCSIEEQEQIGTYFENLDLLITLHQRKHDKLVNLKKSMLEKMFPQEGTDVPEVRFAGFANAWERRKVGDIVTEVERPITMKDEGVYQLVTVKRRNEGVVSRGFLKGKDILVKNYFMIHEGDYLISKRQVIHGANGYVPKELNYAVVSNEYMVAVGNEFVSSKFWVLMSKRREMYRMFLLSSYGVDIEKMVFNVDDWKKRFVMIPSMSEQNRIISFFEHLDTHITLYQRKLTKLQNIKKSCLEKMFV